MVTEENGTLTMAEIEASSPQHTLDGTAIRCYCPIHGSDNQRSMKVWLDDGRYTCYQCGSWGYLESYKEEYLENQRSERTNKKKRSSHRNKSKRKHQSKSRSEPEQYLCGLELVLKIQEFREALPGSPGEDYLDLRGISLEIAHHHCIGYAAYGEWPHQDENGKPIMQAKPGRIVFPHTTPTGEFISLYGRAVDEDLVTNKTDKKIRHAHLPGKKAVFHGKAFNKKTLFVTEGAFDALSLLASGYNATAIFGVTDFRWEWTEKVKKLVFCFDNDETGREKTKELADEAVYRGKKALIFPTEAYQGYEDINELFRNTGEMQLPSLTIG